MWEHIPEEMVFKSYLKCGISNKMDGTKDNALYEDFLGEDVAETEDIAINTDYVDYYDNSLATVLDMRFWTTTGQTRMIPILWDFNHIIRQKIL